MSSQLLAGLVVVPTAAVVVAMFAVMWRERTSTRTAFVAVIAGAVLAAWAALTVVLALRGFYKPPDTRSPPPVGIQLAIALVGLALFLAISPSLRSLLTNQENLIRLNAWRLVGADVRWTDAGALGAPIRHRRCNRRPGRLQRS